MPNSILYHSQSISTDKDASVSWIIASGTHPLSGVRLILRTILLNIWANRKSYLAKL